MPPLTASTGWLIERLSDWAIKSVSHYSLVLIEKDCKALNHQSPDHSMNYLRRLKQRNKLICYWLIRLTGSPGSFEFRGKTYLYFWHRYNATWRNERAVEIPIAREFIAQSRGGNVLEVGNVLSHYGPVQHDVLDKYEKAEGVINEDVCT